MMARKLERVSAQVAGLFDQQREEPTPQSIPKGPVCPLCGNWGYTNCPQAKAPNGGDFIAIAFRYGTACSCAAGAEFAQNQMAFMRPDKTENIQ